MIYTNVHLQRAAAGPAVLSPDGRPAGARLARHGEVRSDLRQDPHKLLQSPLGPVSQLRFFSVAQYTGITFCNITFCNEMTKLKLLGDNLENPSISIKDFTFLNFIEFYFMMSI